LTPPSNDESDEPARKRRRLESCDDIWDHIEKEIDESDDSTNSNLPGVEQEYLGTGAEHGHPRLCPDVDQFCHAGLDIDSCVTPDAYLGAILDGQITDVQYDFDREESPEDQVCFGMVCYLPFFPLQSSLLTTMRLITYPWQHPTP
jgi:hypothetical protein